jgi:hypothetical protein
MKTQKRAEVFILIDRLESAREEVYKSGIDTVRFKRALQKYGNAYCRLTELGIVGEQAERDLKCSR